MFGVCVHALPNPHQELTLPTNTPQKTHPQKQVALSCPRIPDFTFTGVVGVGTNILVADLTRGVDGLEAAVVLNVRPLTNDGETATLKDDVITYACEDYDGIPCATTLTGGFEYTLNNAGKGCGARLGRATVSLVASAVKQELSLDMTIYLDGVSSASLSVSVGAAAAATPDCGTPEDQMRLAKALTKSLGNRPGVVPGSANVTSASCKRTGGGGGRGRRRLQQDTEVCCFVLRCFVWGARMFGFVCWPAFFADRQLPQTPTKKYNNKTTTAPRAQLWLWRRL